MESEPTHPTTSSRRPSGSSARRGSASAASRARTGEAHVDPPRPAAAEVSVLEHPDPPVAEQIVDETPADELVDGELLVEAVLADEVLIEEPEAEQVEDDDSETLEAEDDEVAPEAELAEPVRRPTAVSLADVPASDDSALSVRGLTKYFGGAAAVDGIDLEVRAGSFFGIVGPNGAGKTTTLSMVTGLLRPDDGDVRVFGVDLWKNPRLAKQKIGVLPDRLRLFDRLTGSEFLHHAGALRGLSRATIAQRSADLSKAFGLEHSLHRLVSDYSAGMTKKIAIAAAMIHAPRVLVLDEPFESVDPVSTSVVLEVLARFTEAGGTVVLSSHSMELTERVCDSIAVIIDGQVLAEGPIADVLDGRSLEERFVELAGGAAAVEGMEWLQNFSD